MGHPSGKIMIKGLLNVEKHEARQWNGFYRNFHSKSEDFFPILHSI